MPEAVGPRASGCGQEGPGYGQWLWGGIKWHLGCKQQQQRIDGLWVQLEVIIFCNCGVPLTAAGDCDPWRHSQRSQQIPHNQQNS